MLVQNMKIFNQSFCKPAVVNQHLNSTCAVQNNDSFSYVNFKRKENEKYDSAVKYLESCKKNREIKDINDLDLDKLDGIQEGLKRFEKLTMKQITFVLRDLIAINVNRGCERYCAHCILDSLPPLKNSRKEASTAAFEDFKGLLNDINSLNKRLGFNIMSNRNVVPIVLFFDSDGIKTVLKDKNNKEYNAAQLNHMQYSATKKPGVIDTHGWNPLKEPELQKRAEDIVEYFSKDENQKELFRFNISLNPFDILSQEAVKAEKNKDFETAFKKRFEYAFRIANVLYTFTPIAESDKVKVIQRFAKTDDKDAKPDIKNYGKDAQIKIDMLVLKLLNQMYENDMQNDKKIVKSKQDKDKYMHIWKTKMFERVDYVSALGRMTNFYHNADDLEKRSKAAQDVVDIIKIKKTIAPEEESSNIDYDSPVRGTAIAGQIDVNGKFYVFFDPVSIPTEIQLNYKNKNKITRIPSRGLEKEFLITNKMIESIQKY